MKTAWLCPIAAIACAFLASCSSCSKTDKPEGATAAGSASAAITPAASVASAAPSAASADGGHKHGHEDRHEAAVDGGPALSLDVKIAGTTKTWKKDSFDKVAKVSVGGVGNDGENRDTWSLRELAHTLVGPNARVVTIIGPEDTRTIDRATWDDANRTPILHTTRRGSLKFRFADKAGKWGDTEVKDVSRIEIEP